MRVIDPTSAPYLKALVYGVPGSEKTRFAGTAALDDRTYPCLYLNIAGNPLSMRDYERKPKILEIEEMADFNPIYNWLAQGQDPNNPIVEKFGLLQEGPYKCLIIDQLTETQRIAFRMVTHNEQLGPGTLGKAVGRQEFGSILELMTRFASLFLQLPMHVIIVVQEKTEKDEATGSITVAPYLWGQSDVEVSSFAYITMRMMTRISVPNAMKMDLKIGDDVFAGGSTSIGVFKQSGKYVAKDQYGRCGDYMVAPSVTKILDAIYK